MSRLGSRGRLLDETIRRAIDAAAACVGLVVLSPVLIGVAIAIVIDSRGPILFRQERVGRHEKAFRILKFRSMRPDAERVGGQLTVGTDPRVTRVGRFLRAWKLDELPQLWNVLVGDMSLVGPRPEVPRYVALYGQAERRVFDVRPGITDPASIAFRNESEMMAGHPDPERLYVDTILPEKLRLNLSYLERRTVLTDIALILTTLRAVIGPRRPPRGTRSR